MTIKILGKELGIWFLNGKKLEEIWYGGKKVRPEWLDYNLDLNNSKPIWRMHDWELWFRVHVKDPNEPFKIAVNWYDSTSYDWDISVDWATPVRYQGSRSTTPIQLSMSVGKHYVKITPHSWKHVGWAMCIGNWSGTNYWNKDANKLEFWLEWIPWYAFVKSLGKYNDYFLYYAFYNSDSLTSMPNGLSFPKSIKEVNMFLYNTWYLCDWLTSIPSWFTLPQTIEHLGSSFLGSAWSGCTKLTSIWEWFTLPLKAKWCYSSFLGWTWSDCRSLISMPNSFNLPQGITIVSDLFLAYTRSGCTSLKSMPSEFALPKKIEKNFGGFRFLKSTRNDCKNLTSGHPAKPLEFPDIKSSEYGGDCFWWSCPITPDTPTPWSSVMIRRN